MIVSPLLVRSKTSEVLRVTSRTPIVVVVMSTCYNIDPGARALVGRPRHGALIRSSCTRLPPAS
jgi:hypothetical protein